MKSRTWMWTTVVYLFAGLAMPVEGAKLSRQKSQLFRSLLPVVKPDKAARQTLPTPGKPLRSGPARQDTG
jgi:hypothetical protein